MDKRLHLGLLYGGRSGEHEVSLRSAAAVYKNLDKDKYNCIPIGISKAGRWYLQEISTSAIPDSLPLVTAEDRELVLFPGRGLALHGKMINIDLMLPILHGSFGEDGTLQGALEMANIPYAGSGVLGSALGMDKAAVKKMWEYHDLPVVPYKVLPKRHFTEQSAAFNAFLDDIFTSFYPPLFIKPNRAGSSVGVSKVTGRTDCLEALKLAFRYDRVAIIEQGIIGKEVECAVLEGDPPQASIVGQIVPKHEFYDYKAKYIDADGAELLIPAVCEADEVREIQKMAVRAFQTAENEGFARVDFFIEESTGKIYLNEINSIPGFTSISMFPLLFKASGISFGGILDTIIQCALKRVAEIRDITYTYETETYQ